ncbi:MAG: C40 family peptidase [Chitinophagaceae bacterium]|nr:C40 family peptidase [Chitinophagaceae bacterium]
MKHLFIVAVATGIFTGTSFKTNAQTNANLEQLSGQAKPGNSLKFINSIEITPDRVANDGGYNSTEGQDAALPLSVKEYKAPASPATVKAISTNTSIEKCSSLQFKYALLMDVEVEAVSNFTLYSFIEDWWATRYRYGGSSRDGIDCSAFTGKLTQEVYHATLPRTARDQFQACDMVANEDLQEGDLVFFNTRGGISHVGLYLGNNYFVHSSTSYGVTISSLTDDYYSRKFLGGGRVRK